MRKSTGKITAKAPLSFRWRYIALPVAILLFSVIITAYFYHLLPGEVAYHFQDSAPDKWMSRGAIIAGTLTPQFILVLLAAAIVWVMIKIGTRFPQVEPGRVQSMLSIMGNMFVLPQIILGFAMLNIFSYNSYQIHLMPLWLFALIVMVLGGIILGVFFTRVIRQILRANKIAAEKSTKEQQ
ncbi:hypothetical protein ACFLXG_02040 [Chloroflexota bacterium]